MTEKEITKQIEEAAQIKSRLHDLEQRLRAYAEQINTSYMQGEPAIGAQRFEDVVSSKSFYVDKTGLIKKWWERIPGITGDRSYHLTFLCKCEAK